MEKSIPLGVKGTIVFLSHNGKDNYLHIPKSGPRTWVVDMGLGILD